MLIIAYHMIKMEIAEYFFLPIAEIKNEMISACISIHDNLKEKKVFFNFRCWSLCILYDNQAFAVYIQVFAYFFQ